MLKMGSLCHAVGSKASLGEFTDPTYYTFLDSKQVFCSEVHPNGTSDTVIRKQINGDTDSGDVVSESVSLRKRINTCSM